MLVASVAAQAILAAWRSSLRTLFWKLLLATTLAFCATGTVVHAQNNLGPPSGAILDVGGQAIPHGTAQQYTVTFTATTANTVISFYFRDDPADLLFSDPSVTNTTTGSATNLLQNSTFAAGTYAGGGDSSVPVDWTYANPNNASYGGQVSSGCGALAGSDCWVDGATQAYDSLSQTIATTIGDVYKAIFYLTEDSGQGVFSKLSTDGTAGTGGNGIDVVTYANTGGTATSVPEPGSTPLIGSGVALLVLIRGLGAWRRRGDGDSGGARFEGPDAERPVDDIAPHA